MASWYAPDPGTATTSPTRGRGMVASLTSTSPVSQYLPAIATVAAESSRARLASIGQYSAPYAVGRMLSAMPPSMATYVRTPAISLTDPTVYSATPAGPTIDRPGSTVSLGRAENPWRRAASHTPSPIARVTSAGSIGWSAAV